MKAIKQEEAGYVPLPKFYTFKSRDERERILYKNFVQVGEDVKSVLLSHIVPLEASRPEGHTRRPQREPLSRVDIRIADNSKDGVLPQQLLPDVLQAYGTLV